jgi:2-iminobutanoate/2-iminopropanoate deaminase
MRPRSTSMPYGPVFSWHRTRDGFVFTSAHAAVDVDTLTITTGPIADEVRLTLDNLKRTLERAGSGMQKVVKITAFLTDMGDYRVFNEVYAEFFAGEAPPARTCVAVSQLPYNFRVSIEAIAHT